MATFYKVAKYTKFLNKNGYTMNRHGLYSHSSKFGIFFEDSMLSVYCHDTHSVRQAFGYTPRQL